MKVYNLFPSCVYEVELFEHVEELKKFSFELKNKDKGRVFSNVGGWQSNSFSLNKFKKFKSILLNHLKIYGEYLNLDKTKKHEINQIWCNFNYYKDYNIPHLHLNSILSGVYYLTGNNKMGRLVFWHPSDLPEILWLNVKRDEYTVNNSITYNFFPKPGMLYIFPSWLRHSVEPNQTNEERISIAFDTNLI